MSEIVIVSAKISWLELLDVDALLVPGVMEKKLRESGFKIKPCFSSTMFVDPADLQNRILPPYSWRDTDTGREFTQMYEVFK